MLTDQQWRAAHKKVFTHLQHITVLFTHIIIVTTRLLQLKKDPKPYHTSILTGQGWVEELLSGHPKHICCELGVHRHTFLVLIGVLQELGYSHSKHITLEEQLAIFLYMSVTGLTIQHVGKCLQWSNKTISHYFHHILSTMSSHSSLDMSFSQCQQPLCLISHVTTPGSDLGSMVLWSIGQ